MGLSGTKEFPDFRIIRNITCEMRSEPYDFFKNLNITKDELFEIINYQEKMVLPILEKIDKLKENSEKSIKSEQYKDAIENEAPGKIQVIIDEIPHNMIPLNPLDTDYTDGKSYYYLTKLDAGIHDYYFYCDDGKPGGNFSTLEKQLTVEDKTYIRTFWSKDDEKKNNDCG